LASVTVTLGPPESGYVIADTEGGEVVGSGVTGLLAVHQPA
jgi:hypothetical protein